MSAMLARNKLARHTGTVVLLVPDIAEPFYAQLAREVEASARGHGYRVILYCTDLDLEGEVHYLASLRGDAVDGVIFATPEDDTPCLVRLTERGVPAVALDRGSHGCPVPTVQIDNRQAVRMAVRHLIGLGRTRIAYMTGYYSARQTLRDRLAGYREALAEAGLPFDPALIWRRPSKSGSLLVWGYEVARRYLRTGTPVDAVFAPADSLAVGALRALAELDRSVPDDVAVVGLNDVAQASFTNPPLTAVAQPLREMAALAVGMLLQLIAGQTPSPRHVVFPTELRVRGSCGVVARRHVVSPD